MEISIGSDTKLGIVTIRHNGEELAWNCTGFEHPNLIEPDGIFRDINGLWASFPPDHQDKIWECYKEAHYVLNNVADIKRLRERLVPLVRQLFELTPFSVAEHWIKYRSQMVYPNSLMDDYSSLHPRDTTYLRRDYVELAALALNLRIMVPIWGRFTKLLKPFAARQRERLAVTLLGSSGITETAPYKMLREHVERLKEKHLEKNPVPLSAKADCVGTENIGEMIFCLVLVRRVAMGELSQRNTDINIVSTVYKHVKSQFEGLDKASGGRIGEKHKSREENPEDNASKAESYKAKTDVTPGSIASTQVYTEDLHRLALAVEPNLDLQKLKLCFDAAVQTRASGDYQVTKHQITLIQYVMAKVISPRSLEYPDADQIFNSMVTTQAVLWDWGFPQLAAMMFTCAYELDDVQRLQRKRWSSLSKELRDQLHKLYPYYYFNNNQPRGRNDCFAVQGINLFLGDTSEASWNPKGPQELLVEASTLTPASHRVEFSPDGDLVLPLEMPDILAAFIIKLNEKVF